MPTTTLPTSPSDPDFSPLSTAVPSVPEPPAGGSTGAVIVMRTPSCSVDHTVIAASGRPHKVFRVAISFRRRIRLHLGCWSGHHHRYVQILTRPGSRGRWIGDFP